MKTIIIDARGRSCPEPVIMTKQAINTLDESNNLHVLIDTTVAKENVKRLLTKEKFNIDIKPQEDYFLIVAQKE